MADDDLRPMSQEEIDALFAEVNGGGDEDIESEAEVESVATVQPAQIEEAPAESEEAPQPVAAEPDSAPAAAADPTPPPQAAVEPESEPEEAAPDDASKQPGADALSTGAAPAEAANVSQDDIDALLAELGAGSGGSAEETNSGTQAVAETDTIEELASGPKTESLTAESLAELVSKHSDPDDDDGTGIINQDDIDALVQQMTQAANTPPPDHDQIAAAIQGQDEDIDALLDQAGAGVSIEDAVSPSLIRAAVAPQGAVATLPPGMVMSPDELRGTRYLLVAAVFLLMMCAVTLGFVVASVNGLTAELAKTNQSKITVSDDFAEDMAVGERWLSDSDPVNITKGVIFLDEELKQRYPKRQEVIAERLARHFRETGAHERAVKEFSYIADRTSGLVDDPQFYIDYADSLAHIGKQNTSREVVYELISNEAWFLREQRSDGTPVDEAQLAANRVALQRAMILLGRLYAPEAEAGDQLASFGDATAEVLR